MDGEHYDAVHRHMLRYSGRDPLSGRVHTFRFTGLDYCLVLHAMLPCNCVDLARLCWSDNPAASQLDDNLLLFLSAVEQLNVGNLPDGCALQLENLRSCAANVVHHTLLQRWLYRLSKKYPIDPSYDAAGLRCRMRWEHYAKVATLSAGWDIDHHCRVGVKGQCGAVETICALEIKRQFLVQQLRGVWDVVASGIAEGREIDFCALRVSLEQSS